MEAADSAKAGSAISSRSEVLEREIYFCAADVASNESCTECYYQVLLENIIADRHEVCKFAPQLKSEYISVYRSEG